MSIFLRTSFSSIDVGEVLIFLRGCRVSQLKGGAGGVSVGGEDDIPARFLCFFCDLKLYAILLCSIDAVSDVPMLPAIVAG